MSVPGSKDLKQGVKFDDGKPKMSLLPPIASFGTACVFTYGAEKYAEWNYAKGMKHSRLLDASYRHTETIKMRQFDDVESGLGHVYHAICSLMMLAENMVLHPELDDIGSSEHQQHRDKIDHELDQMRKKLSLAITDLRAKKNEQAK